MLAPVIGTVLDKYEILQKIGEGGMATVYRGRHVTLGRDVAIKVLHPHLSASPRNRNRFAREARAIEHLDHDNILKIYDYSGTETEDCYIVTEFVDGVTLQDLVAEHGHVPSEVAAILGIHLSEALSYAHRHDIIHRDLKPENVMVRRDGTVKLMDFGIARFLDESNLTMTGALVGSPAYMSPEQAMERVLDHRSDLFSLGTLLYHLVTGQLPFSGNNPSIILRNIIEGNRPEVIELRPDVSGRLADLVERLLETDPDDRPSSALDVVNELTKTLAEVQIDPAEDKWALRSWLQEPATYDKRLQDHLKSVLLAEGKARLAKRDHLEALRLFNRLLSIDEENAEVLALVQGMHTDQVERESGPLRTWGIGVSLLGLAFVVTWVLWPRPAPPMPAVTTGAESTGGLAEASIPNAPIDSVRPIVAEPGPAANVATEPTSVAQPAPIERRPAPIATHTARIPPRSQEPAVADALEPAAPLQPAKLTVIVPLGWGRIYVDDVDLGSTSDGKVLTIAPGDHRLKVANPMADSFETPFHVDAGETRTIEAPLKRKPYVIAFQDFGDTCIVSMDGQPKGTVGALSRKYTIEAPDPNKQYLLRVECENEPAREYPLTKLQSGGKRFLSPLSP